MWFLIALMALFLIVFLVTRAVARGPGGIHDVGLHRQVAAELAGDAEVCRADLTQAPQESRLERSPGRPKPRRLLLVGVVAVCAVVAACTAEPQPAGPGTQTAAGVKPLVAQFVDDAEAIEPVLRGCGATRRPSASAGRRFQTRCVGTGDPAVILVSGARHTADHVAPGPRQGRRQDPDLLL